MSLLAKLFGGGKKGGAPPSPQDAIQRLRGIEEMLQKKTDFLEKKIEQELNIARKNGTKNKRGNLQILINIFVNSQKPQEFLGGRVLHSVVSDN